MNATECEPVASTPLKSDVHRDPAPKTEQRPAEGEPQELHELRLRLPADAAETDASESPSLDDVAPIIEALLFAADAPLSAARLAEHAGPGLTQRTVREAIELLNERYAAAGLTFRIEAIARGYQMLSLPEFRPYIQRMNQKSAQTRLSNAALETLSIVAYKQPIIRADIEAIRGVSLGDTLNRLRELGLVKVVGRAEVVGRPQLFGTTRKFLDVFGLSDLKDLPEIEALNLKPAGAAPDGSASEPEPTTPVAPSAAGDDPAAPPTDRSADDAPLRAAAGG